MQAEIGISKGQIFKGKEDRDGEIKWGRRRPSEV